MINSLDILRVGASLNFFFLLRSLEILKKENKKKLPIPRMKFRELEFSNSNIIEEKYNLAESLSKSGKNFPR